MKKRFIAVGFVFIAVVVITVVTVSIGNMYSTQEPQSTTVIYSNAQIGVTVDSWLKITGIEELEGRLAVVAENVSDSDVEYALLTVKTKKGTLTFNVSALLSGTKAVLMCNQDVGSDPDESYTLWQTENKVLFKNKPVMNEDKIEVSVKAGSISVKNISGEDITSDIYIYYKEKRDNNLNGSATGRVRVAGIRADAQTFVNVEGLNENNCQIIFTDYDKEI